ncbi:MAG: hypothetical protein RMI91_11525 [Gemmatales bacterium]|nr:hypothetical protein [Gemmatales bacterium]MDW7995274.1 hypothetical protein [Gemmatales bacterium]
MHSGQKAHALGSRGEPAAAWLLDRCLAYLHDRKSWEGASPRPLHLVGINLASCQFATTPRLHEAAALVIHAASPPGAEYLTKSDWVEYARRSGHVLLHQLSAEQVDTVVKMLNVKS